MIAVIAGRITGDFNGRVTVRNADSLKANLARAQEGAKKAILHAVGEAASKIAQRTIDLCPKRTFFMSQNVRTDFSLHGYAFTVGWWATDFLGSVDNAGRQRSFYPLFVEFGTRHMVAQPSLTIAYQEEEPRFKRSLEIAMKNAYDRTGR